MQFLGLKSKENILVFILKKKQQQEQQPKAFYNAYMNFFSGFFLILFQEMVFTCVRGLCSKIYSKTNKEIQAFLFSLGT